MPFLETWIWGWVKQTVPCKLLRRLLLVWVSLLLHFYLLILEREGERNINLLFHLFIHSLVDSCMSPNWGSNPQPWHIRTMLQPAELASCSHPRFWMKLLRWGSQDCTASVLVRVGSVRCRVCAQRLWQSLYVSGSVAWIRFFHPPGDFVNYPLFK